MYRHFEMLSQCIENVQYFGASRYDRFLESILVFRGEEIESYDIPDIFKLCKEKNIFDGDYEDYMKNE